MAKAKAPHERVGELLIAFNTLNEGIERLNTKERRQLAGYLHTIRGAFESIGDGEETVVPHVDTVSLHAADLAGTLIDSYNLEGDIPHGH